MGCTERTHAASFRRATQITGNAPFSDHIRSSSTPLPIAGIGLKSSRVAPAGDHQETRSAPSTPLAIDIIFMSINLLQKKSRTPVPTRAVPKDQATGPRPVTGPSAGRRLGLARSGGLGGAKGNCSWPVRRNFFGVIFTDIAEASITISGPCGVNGALQPSTPNDTSLDADQRRALVFGHDVAAPDKRRPRQQHRTGR